MAMTAVVMISSMMVKAGLRSFMREVTFMYSWLSCPESSIYLLAPFP